MPGLERFRRWTRSLGVRLPAMLTVALLPVGLIAVVQTAQVSAVAREREELVLLALTEHAASLERRAIERAIGLVQGLAAATLVIAADDAACDAQMERVAGGSSPYSFAGYIPATGVMTCASSEGIVDFSEGTDFRSFMAAPRTTVVARTRGAASAEAVIVISEPVLNAAGEVSGLISVSVAQEDLPGSTLADSAVDLLTFNADGEILKASVPLETAAGSAPRRVPLARLVGRPADVFPGVDGQGRARVFAVVPIVPGVVYTLGSWDRAASLGTYGFAALPVWVFPILMWAMSLAVAYFAVHRLVIRHISMLVLRMRDFARDRTMPSGPAIEAPAELREIELGLVELTEQILRDEAEAENRMHEQKVMMKEIHHRVKNNLQLISSIINMQMRQLPSAEGRLILSRVRDRVLGLATIHRNLYEASDVTGVSADAAVRDIVEQIARTVGPADMGAVALDLDPVSLYPDQAVPLSLFVTEAMTNAIKHGRGGAEGIGVRLINLGDEARLTIENPVGGAHEPVPANEPGGLGNRLIRAFATQLEGRVEIGEADGVYRVVLTFPLEAFAEARPERPLVAGPSPAPAGAG